MIIKLLPDDIADERVFKGMIGVFPFPLLGRLPHRRVRSTIDVIPNFSVFFVDKMREPVVVGPRRYCTNFGSLSASVPTS